MRSIWKFPIVVADEQTIDMPAGAEILCVQAQYNTDPCLWALVDVDAPTERRTIRTFGTGHPFTLEGSNNYIGTYQLHSGQLVFHVFEEV